MWAKGKSPENMTKSLKSVSSTASLWIQHVHWLRVGCKPYPKTVANQRIGRFCPRAHLFAYRHTGQPGNLSLPDYTKSRQVFSFFVTRLLREKLQHVTYIVKLASHYSRHFCVTITRKIPRVNSTHSVDICSFSNKGTLRCLCDNNKNSSLPLKKRLTCPQIRFAFASIHTALLDWMPQQPFSRCQHTHLSDLPIIRELRGCECWGAPS